MNPCSNKQECDPNIIIVWWEMADVQSDILPECPKRSPPYGSSTGAILGFNVHRLLQIRGIQPGARLIQIEGQDVTCWDYDVILYRLNHCLQNRCAFGQKTCIIFRNPSRISP